MKPERDPVADQLADDSFLEPGQVPVEPVRIVSAVEFAAVDEPGAAPLLGSDAEVLIPQGGDVMLYGDGGASKTTLSIDLACHLATGEEWLGAQVLEPVRVGLIEAEGPRALFRRKLRRKLDQWEGADIGDRLLVLESPWADFRFPSTEEVADAVGEHRLDVLIVGPLSRVGMDDHGTLQEVRDFLVQVNEFRTRTGRRLTVFLVHHENKGGAVSGAWEGAGDTLLHAEVHARGRTILTVQKARWSSEWHKRKLELAWTDGEGFEILEEEERDLVREMVEHLRKKGHRTAKEIAASADAGGIAANQNKVRHLLEQNKDLFFSQTGEAAKAVGRHPSSTVWDLLEVNQDSINLDSPASAGGGEDEGELVNPPYRDSPIPDSPPLPQPGVTHPSNHPDSPSPEGDLFTDRFRDTFEEDGE